MHVDPYGQQNQASNNRAGDYYPEVPETLYGIWCKNGSGRSIDTYILSLYIPLLSPAYV